jgi:sulfite reductase beta subunit-like hemoprotein
MGIAPVIAQTRSLYKEQQADIERFEVAIAQYLAGEIEEDVFRVIRLNNGVYGQRQGGTNQMVRIKLPAGTITPEQLHRILTRLGPHHYSSKHSVSLR